MAFFQNPWIPELILRCQDLNSLSEMFRGPKNREDAFPDDVIEAYKYTFSQKSKKISNINVKLIILFILE